MDKFYIGLDVGTDSVGWAVTDENYNIPKFKGNAMWGIRLLDESKTAEERRTFRAARRRLERKKFRQQCLEMLFNEAIAEKDIAFFQRLKESNLYMEDKSIEGKYSVFNDPNYNDIDYHNQYPTIYHLRKDLIENKEPHDVRLVYLALSHIIKNRGHFLFDSDLSSSDNSASIEIAWNSLAAFCKDNYEMDLECDSIEALGNILKDGSLTKTRKKEQVIELLGLNKKVQKAECELVTLFTGGTAKSALLFNNEEYKDCECKTICLSSNYDENSIKYESTFGENFELIEQAKALYDWSLLANILNDNKYISYAKVETYEQHKKDLATLKSFVKKYMNKTDYDKIFNENKKGTCNYLAYSRHTKKSPEETNCTIEKFCDFLKKQLPIECPNSQYQDMYNRISANSFMPKIIMIDNSVIPMQINKQELVAILDNAKEYLPFLNDSDGEKTVYEKIVDIFSFRIPYYVGPLNKHSKKSWIQRKEGKIYPWNFEQIVDVDKSAEEFINNLTSKCTYLHAEDVIPKCSLLYSTFMVLNELNNLRVDGEKITVELKQSIYKNLFEKYNKVTNKRLRDFLASNNGLRDCEISGIDGDFKSNLKSYKDFANIDLPESDKEEIIKAITIFGDDKKLLRKRIEEKYGDKLTAEEIKRVSNLKFTGWSRLSKKFLIDIQGVNKETGEVKNIIRTMWETNDNLMQILSENYTFLTEIENENANEEFTNLKKEVENLYVSPKVKRPIYQSMKIVEELVKIKGKAPDKIFVEVARGGEEKPERKSSRKQRLLDLYKSCQKQEKDLYKLLEKCDESDLRKDALYLYFTQFGKSMYSGKAIDIEQIYNKNICDIDHIFPQSKIKDDSLDNRVLVFKTENEKKSNRYPLDQDVRDNMKGFWYTLLQKELISKKKYERLIRNAPLTDEELSSFISRQLVETRQSTKAIAELLNKRYPKTKIVYVKARLASDFRHEYDFIKCREVNDLHHAKDAYLNVVVGNVYDTQFNVYRNSYLNDLQDGKVSINKLFEYSVKGAWDASNNKSMDIVRKNMLKNNIRYTRYSFKQQGGLFDQNLLKKGNGQVSIKANSAISNIEKYGGYNRPSSMYFTVVKYVDEKGKAVQNIIPIDAVVEKEYRENPNEFFLKYFGIKNPEIVISCLKYNSLISVNGFRMHISSKSGGGHQYVCKPAMQLVLSYEQEKYIHKISRYLEKCQEMRKKKEITPFDKITAKENIDLYDAIVDKLNNSILSAKFLKLGNILADKKETFCDASEYSQCVTIMELLNILHANVRSGNLSGIGESKQSGILTIGNNIKVSKEVNSFKIINQSITGLYENEIELLK